jgi:transcriptional regulator with XRE-family HTH domain
MLTDSEPRRRELGEFLRSHREQLTPAMVGLAPGVRRRTPGLRREEIAQLAGVSATWVSWIEQGRDITVSAAALGRLARILRLAPAERAYLFDLAGRRDPEAVPAIDDAPAEGLADIAAVIGSPAYVLDRSWNALAWNEAAGRLFVGWLDGGADRNLLRYVFLSPLARSLIADWEERARRLAAEFRADYSRDLADTSIHALVDGLRRDSRFFDAAWRAHTVTDREGGLRTFQHPEDGFLRYMQTTFLLARHPEVKLVVLVEGGSRE